MKKRTLIPMVLALLISAGIAAVFLPSMHKARALTCPPNIEKVMNIWAYETRVACGLEQPSSPPIRGSEGAGPLSFGTDKNIILPDNTGTHVTQAEAQVASNTAGTVLVAAYNDTRGVLNSPRCGAGASYSLDTGATWTHLATNTFCQSGTQGHGVNNGDPVMVWDKRHSKFFAVFLSKGCGTNGLGVWTSTDGVTWPVGPCAHSGNDDRPSGWVDNTLTSPHYGRFYITYNDFAAGGTLKSIYLDENTQTWSTPVTTSSTLTDVQVTVGLDGTVFLAAIDHGGGGLNPRHNYLFKSTDGGASWMPLVSMGPAFAAPGVVTCGANAFACMFDLGGMNGGRWRYMGWGDIGASANGVVHYAYTQHGVGSDPGDIYYTRSTDNGATWSTPTKLNLDTGSRSQWQPSLAVDSSGVVVVNWYDARNTTGNYYEVYARKSTDNGFSWSPTEKIVSDTPSPLPEQPDSSIPVYFAGDYNRSYAGSGGLNTTAAIYHMVWTDGLVNIGGYQQEDVFYDKCTAEAGGLCYTP